MSRIISRIGLVLAGVISILVIIYSIIAIGINNKETWTVIAAALAVVTSVFSSWSSQRVLELEEDSQRPYPYPSIDVKSRYGLMLLRITNNGGSAAHNISLKWDKPLKNWKGEIVCFADNEKAPQIAVLLPKESAAVVIGAGNDIYAKNADMNYRGTLEFVDASNKKYKYKFFVSAEPYRSTLVYDEEELKTQHELQKVPDQLKAINVVLDGIKRAIEEPTKTRLSPPGKTFPRKNKYRS